MKLKSQIIWSVSPHDLEDRLNNLYSLDEFQGLVSLEVLNRSEIYVLVTYLTKDED